MKRIILFLALMLLGEPLCAKIVLPEILGSNMVLQQDTRVRLWGKATPNAEVCITTSWGAETSTQALKDGTWTLWLETPKGSFTPQIISLSETCSPMDTLTLKDVLIGEVWFAGGQSNMEMPLGGFPNSPIEGGRDAICRAGNLSNRIRFANIVHSTALTPQEEVAGKWMKFTLATASQCSAVGYFFAELLSDVLQVPVGIINCSWGGSRIEGWLNRETLETYTDPVESLEEKVMNRDPKVFRHPMKMYNAMLHPLRNYTLKGFLFYHGEANSYHPENYAQRMCDMVKLWRKVWGMGDLPFYYVEVAPYIYQDRTAALLREQQQRVQDLLPNMGMVSTIDLVEAYEYRNIHPKKKEEIGHRLAFWALNRNYGFNQIECESPRLKEVRYEGNTAHVAFTHAEKGFDRMYDIQGFEIAGKDGNFYPAKASLKRQVPYTISLSSPHVSHPKAVRYLFKNYVKGELHNTWGLPVCPFRTDNEK